jgi:hypothetical protein
MIELPPSCLRRSISKHNIDIQIFSDWVEGNVLFDSDEMSKTDIIDVLMENEIYADQDFAAEFVEDVWRELQRRFSLVGNDCLPLRISARRISRVFDWQATSAFSFCLILSFQVWYKAWARQFGDDYLEQGAIFEELTKESLMSLFPGWTVHPTGWEKDNPVQIRDILQDVANRVNEPQGDVSRWVNPKAKDLGLDVICYRTFADERGGKPVFLFQCASGNDWEDKLLTPEQILWNRIIGWASNPKKGFSMPIALSEDAFTRSCGRVNGLLLDRYRLLSVGRENPNWISNELRERIVAWLEPRIGTIPNGMNPVNN